MAHGAISTPRAGFHRRVSAARAALLLATLFGALVACKCDADTLAPAASGDAIHALIVGVDHYRFSTARQAGAAFPDLAGAVGDANRFRQALAELYGVSVTAADKRDCTVPAQASAMLTDNCATRARILQTLDAQIAALKPGDTLLFYFAGHGSQYRDDEAFDQDSGYNGTILPYDARNPDGSPGDIFDVELKARKDRATAAGIYFVSIFDSCNSATATREGAAGQSRSVPPLHGRAPASAASAAPAGPGGGYWVHLAAAQDGEEAQETPSGAVGARAGVFTTALIDTLHMPGMRDATFGDMIREVRLRVASQGHSAQTPSAEGSLTAAMGARARRLVLVPAVASDGGAMLQAGSLSGVTIGSRYALYSSQADAIAKVVPLATASVVAVDRNSARIKPDGSAALHKDMVAQEVAHFFPADLVRVSNDLPPGKAHDAVARALAAIGFVTVSPHGTTHLALRKGTAATVDLRADDGTLLSGGLGAAVAPAFRDRLVDELRKVARVAQLLALRTSAQDQAGQGTTLVDLCVAADGYRPTSCPAVGQGNVRSLSTDTGTTATVINRGTRPLYVYVLAIDPMNAVDAVLPKPDEFDQKLQPGQPYRRQNMTFDAPGTYRFVTIATDQPIRADALTQSGNGARAIGACVSPLERLLCAASEGQRDPGVTAVGDWSAQVSTVIVRKAGAAK